MSKSLSSGRVAQIVTIASEQAEQARVCLFSAYELADRLREFEEKEARGEISDYDRDRGIQIRVQLRLVTSHMRDLYKGAFEDLDSL